MTIRKAEPGDIPFLVKAICSIEASENGNTYSRLLGCSTEEAERYLVQFFLDEDNHGNELALDTYAVAEIEGIPAGCCALIYTDQAYMQNKGDLFPIHLSSEHLANFARNVKSLPSSQIPENQFFAEYIYTDVKFRGRGVAQQLIAANAKKAGTETILINVLENNNAALRYYEHLGFRCKEKVFIDPEQKFYPSAHKIILEGTVIL